MCFVSALAGENLGLTQLNMDIISEHFNLNITLVQVNVIANVLNMTYKPMGVKEDNLMKFVGRNYPVKSRSYMKTLTRRRVHAIDAVQDSGPEVHGRVYRDNFF